MTMLHVKLTIKLKNNKSITFPLAWEKNCPTCKFKAEYLLQEDSIHTQYNDDEKGLAYFKNFIHELNKHVEVEHS